MRIYRKEPDIQFAKVNRNGNNWYVPVERLTPQKSFMEKHYPLFFVAGTVLLASWMLIGAMR